MAIRSKGDRTSLSAPELNRESMGTSGWRVRRASCCSGSVIFSRLGLEDFTQEEQTHSAASSTSRILRNRGIKSIKW